MRKNLFFLCLSIFCILGLSVAAAQENGFVEIQLINGCAVVTGSDKNAERIVVPDFYEGVPVTAIGEYAFYFSAAEEILLPDTITRMDECAFWRCTELKAITLPDALETIDTGAFCDCPLLQELYIPEHVSFIADGAFSGCGSLSRIRVSKENNSFADLDGVLYTKEYAQLLCYPQGKTQTFYKLPDSVTQVSPFAFYKTSLNRIYHTPDADFSQVLF